MGRSSTSGLFAEQRILAILRFRERCDLAAVLDALADGGVALAEITIDTPGALDSVRRVASAGRPVGVGTIVTAEQVDAAADAGATFVVSPGLIPEVIDRARRLSLEAIPGVYTATEIVAAQAAGAQTMKLFPACNGGPEYLGAIRGPFPRAALMPTGGIGLDSVGAYLRAGGVAVALGTGLVGHEAPRTDRQLAAIAERARTASAAAGDTAGP